jgi:microcystin-dependent protein
MDAFMGTILLLPIDYAPQGWLLCDGQKIPIVSNQAMFALLGTKFGGDGKSNFAIPDLRGKEPAPNMAYYIAMVGIWPSRD